MSDLPQDLQRRDPLQDPHRAGAPQDEEGRLREVPGNVSDQENLENTHFEIPRRHESLEGLPPVRALQKALRNQLQPPKARPDEARKLETLPVQAMRQKLQLAVHAEGPHRGSAPKHPQIRVPHLQRQVHQPDRAELPHPGGPFD